MKGVREKLSAKKSFVKDFEINIQDVLLVFQGNGIGKWIGSGCAKINPHENYKIRAARVHRVDLGIDTNFIYTNILQVWNMMNTWKWKQGNFAHSYFPFQKL